ncbi:hypothetical protein XELAEV_18016102mg [Xenopus laevis]|uniref:Uncharacterized protein n=1 Tax=Xenopus laevis TaxID=8355 RepID=A0A974DLN8_XENLA|nr:hypothetical protein XELAEV_18016102mg [Xenopus laevis]
MECGDGYRSVGTGKSYNKQQRAGPRQYMAKASISVLHNDEQSGGTEYGSRAERHSSGSTSGGTANESIAWRISYCAKQGDKVL